MPKTNEQFSTTCTDKDGAELTVRLDFTLLRGAPQTRMQPADPDEIEIQHAWDENGKDILDTLSPAEVDRLTDLLYEQVGEGTFEPELPEDDDE